MGKTKRSRPIAIGDLVVLKSGGPVMVVSAYEEDSPRVLCDWFDNFDGHWGETHSEWFYVAVLTLAELSGS